ncbi:hypothetical protein [Actinomyces wuliandei]|uniref:hypothetical protein n=1 Tax=Actinomyces wuliandei TaxID=2057743 RepID=UPI001FAB3008|nr:hypothetical protein [Actinomyces wuliandei]
MSVSSGGRRRHRRVVVLSSRDRDRVARGEVPEDLAQAGSTTGALRSAAACGETGPGSAYDSSGGAGWADGVVRAGDADANDARLLRDVPPHW